MTTALFDLALDAIVYVLQLWPCQREDPWHLGPIDLDPEEVL